MFPRIYLPKVLHACLLVVALIFFCGFLSSKENIQFSKYSETALLMGTNVRVDYCYKDVPLAKREEVFQKVWERLAEIHWRMSIFDKKSDVNKVNRAYSKPIKIKSDTYQLIKESKRLSILTYGAFDITVWPIIKLWKKGVEDNTFPSEEQVKAAKEAVGFDNIELSENNRVKLLNKETKIDLGGIAKGYAIDEAARIFRENGFNDFLIDAGGDVYVGGSNCERQSWRVGIKDPRDITNMIEKVAVRNQAVATSGDYHQFFEIQGQRFSHIINPVTGYPQKGVVSATVIAPDATKADALATALTVLSPVVGIKLIEQLGEEYAAMVVIKISNEKIEKVKSERFKKLSNSK